MNSPKARYLGAALVLGLWGCRSGLSGGAPGGAAGAGGETSPSSGTPYIFNLPPGFPAPPEPPENRATVEKVELGRHLFYDVRLSSNDSESCSSCHQQALAFTDGRRVGVGSTGDETPRNSMTLANVAFASTLTWANPKQLTLERQAIVPMFGTSPVELGVKKASDLEEELGQIQRYQELFQAAFPEAEKLATLEQTTEALSAFQRTLISGNSPFDRWQNGEDSDAMSEGAVRGHQAFSSAKFGCFHCHQGFNFSDHVNWQDKAFFETPYHNTGLYNLDGAGAYPEPNTGVFEVTQNPVDMGRFKAPTLRNVAVTAPYMHDGSSATLDDVLEHYARGGREIGSGPNAGDGATSPLKDRLVVGFELTSGERADLKEFLAALTDTEFLTNPKFSDPWKAE